MSRKLGRLFRPGMGAYFFVMAVFCAATLLESNYRLAAAEAFITLLMLWIYLIRRKRRDADIQKYMEEAQETMEHTSRGEGPLPAVLICMRDGGIYWANQGFSELTGYADGMMEQYLEEVLPDFSTEWLLAGKTQCSETVTLNGHNYRIYGNIVHTQEDDGDLKGVLYFVDLTELHQIRDEYIRSRPVVAIILIDNYEELTKNLTESGISSLNAKLGDEITAWAVNYNGLLRKLERNRYLFIFEKCDLNRAVEDKFSLLEKIHEITGPSGLPASLSIGVGVEGTGFDEAYNFAALSIEMALSRGGDQAVVRDRKNFHFYGGSAKESAYRSMVRSRVTANSLMELIGHSGQVFVMGHKNADLDVVGAAAGIVCLCRKKGKKASIVMDLEKNMCPELIEEIRAVPEYQDVFLSGQDALQAVDNHSVLIVVDTNRPELVECGPLLEAVTKVCVVDHHRRAADYIEHAVVNFHDTNASSTAEMVTELLLYAAETKDVLPVEAKALLAGICLDTKFFNVRTSEYTFEAAAALNRMGADTLAVKRLLQSGFQETLAKFQIIKSSRIYRQEIAVAALNAATTRPLAAKAADELLNISGITASFVLYPDGDQVIVSARSIGTVNVQTILEPLGGGGNPSVAGAQLKHADVKDVHDWLVESIEKLYEQ